VNYLLSLGVEFFPELKPLEGREGQGAYRTLLPGGAGLGILQAYQEAGGEVLAPAKMTGLIRDQTTGRALGIQAETGEGVINIKARQAVIIATGVWGQDEKMLKQEWPTLPQDVVSASMKAAANGVPFGTYDGTAVKAAMAAGCGTRQMGFIGAEPYYATEKYEQLGVVAFGLSRLPNELHVNLEGKRFYDESLARGTMSKAILQQTDNCYLVLEDSKLIPSEMMPFYTEENLETWASEGHMVKADSIEELAAGLESIWGVPATTVLETITHYNEYCASGIDAEFGKPAPFLSSVDTPPFWAGPLMTVHAFYTLGGLDNDAEARVHDLNGEVIPGLYSAGMAAGGHFGQDAIMGTYQTNAIVFGRIAGKNAAAE
jgi:succinate dehydrogenase/fumarate reductase flavoprotein subunit